MIDFERTAAQVQQNLDVWQKECDTAQRLSALQIKAAVKEYLAANPTPPDIGTLHQLAPLLLKRSHNEDALHASSNEALALINALLESYPDFTPDEQEQEHRIPCSLAISIAYFDSETFANAATRFASLFEAFSALPCQSFTEAVEEVTNGKATFALLPIEDSEQGKLTRFYEQIDHFELHVIAAFDVLLHTGDTKVRVALVGKSLLALPQRPAANVLECMLYEESKYSLTTLLKTAEAMDLVLWRIDSLPISYRADGFFKHLVFEGSPNACRKLRTYIALFMPRTSITADYILLKDDQGK